MYSGQTGWVAEYDRQIKYLDYMENGQRSRGAGFVKLERRDGVCNISLQVSGLYRKDHFTRPLLLIGDGQERELCKLQLADGGIKTYLEGLDSHSLDGQGLRYERLQGIRIPISEGKEIRCLWGKPQEREETAKPQETQKLRESQVSDGQPAEDGIEIRSETDARVGKELGEGRESGIEREARVGRKFGLGRESRAGREFGVGRESGTGEISGLGLEPREGREFVVGRESGTGEISGLGQESGEGREFGVGQESGTGEISGLGLEPREGQNVRIGQESVLGRESGIGRVGTEQGYRVAPESEQSGARGGFHARETEAADGTLTAFKEDKWSQLCAIYPHIFPFSDEREYLSFGLSDFVVLSERYYKLVNNSFLLHGYYTHHYLILTRVVQRGNARYYIGVPGYLLDKEKRTAIMFGFEGFECESEPASEGDFGFYLISVDI
ncbi:MAG: hypothetical protein NC092_12970 [Butyrivibrio sp.]|nr:hypothetical protein [Muribaculum sp.]MCM1553586.1 hypothetical protein [Butyrivibrio sp.]